MASRFRVSIFRLLELGLGCAAGKGKPGLEDMLTMTLAFTRKADESGMSWK